MVRSRRSVVRGDLESSPSARAAHVAVCVRVPAVEWQCVRVCVQPPVRAIMAQQPEPQPEPQQDTTDAETLVAAWFSELCNSQSSSWPAGGEVTEVVARTLAALRRGCIPEEDWLSELRGLERAGQLQSFLSSPAGAPQPDDDDADNGASSGGNNASHQRGPPHSASPMPAPRFAHVDATDGSAYPYGDADNALIAEAKARGLPSVRISDVVLPGGKVLRSEVRFQTETSVAGSRRTEQTWGARGSPTGMAQVNIDNENTRQVTQTGELGMIPQAVATRPIQPATLSGPAPAPAPEPAATATPPQASAALAVCTMQFLHVAGPEEDYKRTPYGDADNALISDAKARGLPSVRINDVVLPGGKVLRFEVRFQTETSVAGSRRTEQTWGARGSPTGMAQVNIDNENTRIVEPILPDSVSGALERAFSLLLSWDWLIARTGSLETLV